MITTEYNTTKLVFGTHEKASISVNATTMKLILQEISTVKEVGDTLKEEDIKELPKIVMEFNRYESIDVLIKALQFIKDDYMKKYGFALAC